MSDQAIFEELARNYGVHAAQKLRGDASNRQYWRGENGIAMIDRAEGAAIRLDRYVDIAGRLRRAGVIVPEIRQDDRQNGILILSDLGDRTLAAEADAFNSHAALDLIGQVQKAEQGGLVHYDASIYAEELSRLGGFYLSHFGIDDHDLSALSADLNQEMAAMASGFVHVDYHAENLLLQERGIGVIDFQDARFGHALYDLVSFVDDVRRPISEITRSEFIEYYFKRRPKIAEARDIDWLGAQRLLKIIGIFARLYSEGRFGYAAFMPRCFELVDLRLRHAELRLVREWFYDVVPAWDELKFRDFFEFDRE